MPKRNTPKHNMPPDKTKEKKTKSEAGRKYEEGEDDTGVILRVSCNKSVFEHLYCVIVVTTGNIANVLVYQRKNLMCLLNPLQA